jgi:hypothetical protein
MIITIPTSKVKRLKTSAGVDAERKLRVSGVRFQIRGGGSSPEVNPPS